MGQLKRSVATLRIIGDDLDPAEISRWLGVSPTFSQKKGELIVGRRTKRVATIGIWSLRATELEPADVDAQIKEILDRLPADLSVWQYITGEYRIDLFCGWFLGNYNEGISISPESMIALGSRGILLDMDIYSSPEEDEEHSGNE